MPTRLPDAFRELAALQDRMNRVFEETLSRPRRGEEEVPAGAWSPAVDVSETPQRLLLRAELPGVSSDQLQLQVDEGILTISGEKTFDREASGETFLRVERSHGAFRRSFALPAEVDASAVTAGLEDGDLTVVLPKRASAAPRRIAVKVGDAAPAAPTVEGKKV